MKRCVLANSNDPSTSDTVLVHSKEDQDTGVIIKAEAKKVDCADLDNCVKNILSWEMVIILAK